MQQSNVFFPSRYAVATSFRQPIKAHNKALQTDSQQRHSTQLLTAKLVMALLAAAELVVVPYQLREEGFEMSEPKRIQRKRTKGWRMPEGAIYVGRGSKWGNPYRIGDDVPGLEGAPMDADDATGFFEIFLPGEIREAAQNELRGKTLACWCPADRPCHADILLKLANETS